MRRARKRASKSVMALGVPEVHPDYYSLLICCGLSYIVFVTGAPIFMQAKKKTKKKLLQLCFSFSFFLLLPGRLHL